MLPLSRIDTKYRERNRPSLPIIFELYHNQPQCLQKHLTNTNHTHSGAFKYNSDEVSQQNLVQSQEVTPLLQQVSVPHTNQGNKLGATQLTEPKLSIQKQLLTTGLFKRSSLVQTDKAPICHGRLLATTNTKTPQGLTTKVIIIY